MKTAEKCYEGFHFFISTIDKIALLIMLLSISADVIARLLFGSGIVWGQEVATIFFVWFTFLSMVEGVKHKLHISITILFDRMPVKVQVFLNYFSEAAVGMVGALMCFYGFKLLGTATRTLAATGWSAKWLYVCIPIAGFIILLDSIIFIVKRAKGQAAEEELDEEAKIIKEAKEEM